MVAHFFIVLLCLLYPRLIAASGRQGGDSCGERLRPEERSSGSD